MGCVQSYFRKAHKAGLSPSSTQGSENAGLIAASPTDPAKQLLTDELPPIENVITTSPTPVTSLPAAEHEVPNGHAPGTNGGPPQSGLGLLGPGIAALAASTGTVAILGAAADTTKEAVEDIAQEVGDVQKEVETLVDETKGAIEDVGADVQKEVEASIDAVEEKIESIGTGIGDAEKEVGNVVENMKEAIEGAGIDALKEVETAVGTAKETVEDTAEDIQSELESVVGTAKEGLEDVAKDTQEHVDASIGSVKETIETITTGVEEAKQEVESIVDKTKEAFSDVEKDVGDVKDSLVEAADDSISHVKKVEEEITESLDGKLSELVSDVTISTAEIAQKLNTADIDVDIETLEEIVKSTTPLQEDVATAVSKSLEIIDDFPAPPPLVDDMSLIKSLGEDAQDILATSDSLVSETIVRAKRSVSELETTEDPRPESASERKADSRPASSVIVESEDHSRPSSIAEIAIDKVTSLEPVSKAGTDLIDVLEKGASSLVSEVENVVLSTSSDVQTSLDEVIEKAAVDISDTVAVESAINKSEAESIQEIITNGTDDAIQVTEDLKTIHDENIASLGSEGSKLIDDIKPVDLSENMEIPERALSKAEQIELVEEEAEKVVNEVVQTVTELVTKSATTIQATFRGHQSRLNMKKTADDRATPELAVNGDGSEDLTSRVGQEDTTEVIEDIFPPPPEDSDSDLLSATDDKGNSGTVTTDEIQSTSNEDNYIQKIINVTINPDIVGGSPTSLAESDKASDAKSDALSTAPAESEPESLDAFLVGANRAASVVSESTVSIGDSISALKGSETDSVGGLSVSEDVTASAAGVKEEDRLGSAATTIQASFRGFQARQNLQKDADDTQLPLPEPLPFEEPADEDDLPPPPEECDIEPPPPLEIDELASLASVSTDLTDTPRSPETGEKLKKEEEQHQVSDVASAENNGDHVMNVATSEDQDRLEAEQLAKLQRPQVCDELPEHRNGNADLDLGIEDVISEQPEALLESFNKEDLVNGTSKDAVSSAEVDDSSLSSAATKIQAGARGYLTRKLIKDTFSTTAPSITDSITDDGVHSSGSLETEVQRQSIEDQNVGVTAVVISNATEKVASSLENGISELIDGVTSGKGLSLDSQLQEDKKANLTSSSSLQNPGTVPTEEDQQVWTALQTGMEDAATKIQSNFRGFSTRQRLQRENAVQMPTTSSGTPATTSESSDYVPTVARSSGEFHDMIVLPSSPVVPEGNNLDSSVANDALAGRQTSNVGKRREGPDVTATPASHTDVVDSREGIITMGTADAEAATEEHRTPDMKGEHATNAATKIQAGFRGYKVRKQMRDLQRAGVKKNGPQRRRRSSNSVTAVQQALPEIKDKETTLQDRSATTIQAGIRGFLVRKRRQEEKKAAVKIQAGFRGYQVRRNVKTRAPTEK